MDTAWLATVFTIVLVATAPSGSVAAMDQQPVAGGEPTELTALVEEAIANNPEIRAAARKVDAAKAMVPQARTLPDPMLVFSYEDVDFRETMYGFSQEIPFPGKLRLKGEVAEREAEGMAHDSDATRRRIVARLKEAYYDLVLARESIAVMEKNRQLLVQFERAAEAGYEVGRMAQADVFRAQAEVSRSLARLATARQQQRSGAAELGRLLGRPPEDVVEVAGIVRPVALRRGADELAAFIDDSPMVLSRTKEVEKRNSAVELARREYLPDFEVVLQGVHDEPMGSDGYQLMLNVSVPLFFASKQRYGVREALASRDGATGDLVATRQELVMRVKDEVARAERSGELISLLEGAILPQAELTLASARSGYSVGRVDFLTLVSSLFALQENELELRMEIVEHEKARARLEEIIGEEP